MRSLFLKIFLSYWIAQALFLVLAIIVTLAMRPSREISNLQAQEPKFLNEALQAYQSGGDEAARKYFRTIRDNQHVRIYIFDDHGRELLERSQPPWIERARHGRIHTADTFLGRFGPGQVLSQTLTADNGRNYMLIDRFAAGRAAILWTARHSRRRSSDRHHFFGVGVLHPGTILDFAHRPASWRDPETGLWRSDGSRGHAGYRRHDEMAELMRDFDRMAERLESLVNAQSRLLTDISHELRSPLARLNVALELARQRSGTEATSALDRIDRESNRLNELIQKLLTIARLESGDESIEKSPVHLDRLVQEIARDAAFEAQSRHCQVEAEIIDDCIVMGSPSLLHSAIENVVRNAIRYTDEGTKVELVLERDVKVSADTGLKKIALQEAQPASDAADKEEAVVRVIDSGPGVPEDAIDKLFRPFYRIDDARGRQTGGVGLGLAITDRAVRLHGGTIRISNRPEGGLMVEIRLPLSSVKPPNPATVTILSRQL